MATPDTTIGAQLRALIRLQHLDTLIDQVIKERGDLPEEIQNLEDETAGLQTRIDKIEQEQKEVEVRRRRCQADTEESMSLISKYEEQQLKVRNNREYDALTKEIEAQNARILEAEEFVQETDGKVDEFASAVEETQTRLNELSDLLNDKRTQLDDVLETTEQKQSQLEDTRKAAESDVDDRYLRAYTRLRKRLRDGRAVVMLQQGAAGGFAVPPQRQVEIRQRNRIVACEHTGRIIVDTELYEETTKDISV